MVNPLKGMGQLMKMQKEMKKMEAAGTSKDDLVKVRMNGLMKITAVEIDDSLLSPGSGKIIEKKILEAHKAAQKKIEKVMRESMSVGDVQQMSKMAQQYR